MTKVLKNTTPASAGRRINEAIPWLVVRGIVIHDSYFKTRIDKRADANERPEALLAQELLHVQRRARQVALSASTGKVARESVKLQARSALEVSAMHHAVRNDGIEPRALGCGRGRREADARSSAEGLRNGRTPFIAVGPQDGRGNAGNARDWRVEVGIAHAGV